jgi:hypothetical protein
VLARADAQGFQLPGGQQAAIITNRSPSTQSLQLFVGSSQTPLTNELQVTTVWSSDPGAVNTADKPRNVAAQALSVSGGGLVAIQPYSVTSAVWG